MDLSRNRVSDLEILIKKITPSIGISIGLIFLVIAVILNKYFDGNFISLILQTLAITFIVASTIGYSIDSSMKEALVNLYENNMTMCALSNKIGLYKILYDHEYDYNNLVTKRKELTIVMNDGKRWISNNYTILSERFKNEQNYTKFVFLKPNSDAIKLLAQKTRKEGQTVEDKVKNINDKIQDSIRELNQIKGKGNLKIYYSEAYNVQTIFLTEREVVLTLYRTSFGIKKTKVPLLVYNKNNFSREGEYEFIKDDVGFIIGESQEAN